MKRYSVIDIIQEANPLHQSNPSLGEFVFIGLVKDELQEQPFRVLIENFETIEEAKAQLDGWIAAREKEDEAREAEAARESGRSKAASTLDSLKKAILS